MASSSCSTCGIATFFNTEMKQQNEGISSQIAFLRHYIFRKCNISIYATNVVPGFMLVLKLLVFNIRTTQKPIISCCCFAFLDNLQQEYRISVLKNVAMPQVEQELLAIPEHLSLPISFESHH
jgi:hypothetical protein